MTIVATVQTRIRGFLDDAGVPDVQMQRDGGLSYRMGSTQVFVRVVEREIRVGAVNALVEIFAPVISNVPRSPELFEYIATQGDDRSFGHLVALAHQSEPSLVNIVMVHRLFGDALTREGFLSAAMGLGGGANGIDEVLAAHFGGQRYHQDD